MSQLSLSIHLFWLERRVRSLARSLSSTLPIPHSYRKTNLAVFCLLTGVLALSSLMHAQSREQKSGLVHQRSDSTLINAVTNGHDLEFRAESAQMYTQQPALVHRSLPQNGGNPILKIAEQTSPYLVGVISGRGGKVENIGSGIVLNSSGVVITSYELVKDASALTIRLGGKNFDQVVLLAYNPARDLAALRVSSAYLALPPTRSQGLEADEPVYVVWKEAGDYPKVALGALKTTAQASSSGEPPSQPVLLEFAAALDTPARGAALVDRHGNVLGMVTGSESKGGFHSAVPMTSLLHFSAFSGRIFEPGTQLRLAGESANGTDSLHNVQPAKLGKYNRTFAVSSSTVLIPRDHMLQSLRNQSGFAALDLVVMDDLRAAEVLVEVDHIPWTFDYTFKVVDQGTSAVIGAGRVTAFNGYIAAGDLADKIVKQLKQWKEADKAAEKK